MPQERAKKEAEERAHAEATAKAHEDAAKKEAIEPARRKVAEEKAKTEAELAALEAQKAQLLQAREAEAARAREEAEARAAAATAAAMEEAEAKLRHETPPGGSRVETLRRLFEGDASSRMKLDEADTGSSGSGSTTARRRRKGKGKTPERPRRPAGGHPHDSDPFFTASDGDERGRRHRQVVAWTGGGGGDVPMEGEDEDPPPPYRSSESSVTETPRWGDMDEDDDMDFGITRRRHPRTHRGDPAETHRDPLAEDLQDPLEDAHPVDPLEADHLAGEDPLDRADPAEALLEDPLGTPATRQGKATRMPPGGGLFYLRRRVQLLELEVDTGKSEMARISTVAARAQKDLDIARAETKSLTNVVSGLQERLDALEARGRVGSDHPPLESGSSDDGWGPGPGPGRPHAPAEPPGVAPAPVPPLSPPPLTTARAAATIACRPAVAVRNGAMSGSARTTTTAVPHRGRLYAPDARHQPRRQSPGLEDVMVDSGMRSPEETWSGMSAKVRTWTWTWTWRSSTSARRVVYDGRPLNAAAGAVMRMRTWMQYGVNISVQRTWRNRGVATGIPWRRWTWRPWESVGEGDGNLGRPRGRRSWSPRPRTPPCGKT